MRRYCLALDLKNDLKLIKEYIDWHQNVWPEIKINMIDCGINSLEIYNYQNRLFMIMEVNDDFSFDRKSQLEAANEKVQEWEEMMWKYQEKLPGTDSAEKWVLMNRIFSIAD